MCTQGLWVDHIWKLVLYRYNQVKWGHNGLGWALNQKPVLLRGQGIFGDMKRHTHRGTKAMWQWRQRLEGCSCTPTCTKEEARKGTSLEPSESMALWFPWFQTPRSQNHGRTLLFSRLFSGMYFVTLFQYLSIQNKDTFIKIQYTKVDRAPLYDKPYRGTLWGAQK